MKRKMTNAIGWLAVVSTLLSAGINTAVGQTDYPRAGWETHLTQTGHGVKGTATILNERTIRLTHFSYDGAAPDMYVYLATNQTSAAFQNGGLTISPRLARSYNDETLDVSLPAEQSLDGWTAISIWCRAVQASFGWGTFAPPTQPSLTVTRLTNAVAVKLTGEMGQKYWVQGNTNMLGTNGWQSLVLLTNVTGTVRYTNSPVTNPGRFFRALRY